MRPTNTYRQEREALHQQGLRLCKICKEVKPISDYGRSNKDPYYLQPSCKECTNKRNREVYAPNLSREQKLGWQRAWRKDPINRAKSLKWNAKQNIQRYGISFEEWTQMLLAQSGRCQICEKPMMPDTIDHNHETGKVRGLLCGRCNSGLGHFKENYRSLARAVQYLQKFEV